MRFAAVVTAVSAFALQATALAIQSRQDTTCAATCTASGIDLLSCVNVLSGAPFSVPITVGKRDEVVEERQSASYCCNADGALPLVTCTNILSGSLLSVPITLFPGLTAALTSLIPKPTAA